MADWLPINTAPRDREILLRGVWLSGRNEIRRGRYLATRWPFVGEGQPTEWMEIPKVVRSGSEFILELPPVPDGALDIWRLCSDGKRVIAAISGLPPVIFEKPTD